MIDRKLISRLADISREWCATLYIPKVEQEGQYELDRLRFNKAVATVVEQLRNRGMAEAEAGAFVAALKELPDRGHFFNRYQPGLLAVFFDPDVLEVVELPRLELEESVYVGREFYLRPILSLLNGLERFFVLSLSGDNVLLYEGSEAGILQAGNLTPVEYVGKNSRQIRLAAQNDDQAVELKRYFRRVDEKLQETLAQEKAPLILAASEKIALLYRELSGYSPVLAEAVDFVPEKEDLGVLLKRVRPLFQEYLRTAKKEKRRLFIREMLKGNASISLTDILAAADSGQVTALFLDRDEFTTGEYKAAIQWARVDEQPSEDHTALFNLAAIKTFQRGGEVYNLARNEMPDETTPINATFRTD